MSDLLDQAEAALEDGRAEEAASLLEALVAREPKDVTALLALADVLVRELDDAQSAMPLLDRAQKLAKNDEFLLAELALLRGLAFSLAGALEDALHSFERALRYDETLDEAQFERAVAVFELGRVAEARAAFEQLTRDFPEEPWSHHYLGLLAERRGENPQPFFDKARALSPEDFPPPVHLDEAQFDAAVKAAIDALPAHAKPHLDNVIIDVEPLPSDDDLAEGLSPTILGVFVGTPVDERLDTHAEHHHTARIVLFQKNLERFATTREELLEEISITVLHEVGHLLGLDEDELAERGLD